MRWGCHLIGGVGLAATLLVISATSAEARRVAADGNLLSAESACSLGSSCAPLTQQGLNSPLSLGSLNDVYVYDDGVISVGHPLPLSASVAGGARSLGDDFIAPGFAEYDSVQMFEKAVLGASNVISELEIYWSIDDPSGATRILGVTLSNEPDGEVGFSFSYGAAVGSWYDAAGSSPYLPDGAVVGWRQGGDRSLVTMSPLLNLDSLDNYLGQGTVGTTPFLDPTPPQQSASIESAIVDRGVPEPKTWVTMSLGAGAIGAALRRRRRWALPVL